MKSFESPLIPEPCPLPPKQWTGIAMVVAGMVFLLGITNPNETSYSTYLARKVKETSCQEKRPSEPKQFLCTNVAPLFHGMTTQVLAGCTQRQTYVLFSVYRTDCFGLKVHGIGIAGHFILYQ